jgi:hypothetical protein
MLLLLLFRPNSTPSAEPGWNAPLTPHNPVLAFFVCAILAIILTPILLWVYETVKNAFRRRSH